MIGVGTLYVGFNVCCVLVLYRFDIMDDGSHKFHAGLVGGHESSAELHIVVWGLHIGVYKCGVVDELLCRVQ